MRWSFAAIVISLVVIVVVVPRVVRGQELPAAATPGNVIVVESAGGDGQAAPVRILSFAPAGGTGLTFSYGGVEDSFSLLNWEQVRKELELLDEQMEQIQSIRGEMTRKHSDLMKRLGPDGFRQPDVAAAMQEEMKEIRDQARTDLEKLLLPHQHERLQQISRRMAMQRRGTATGLTGDELANALGLSDEQKQRLRERGKEIEEEMRQELARLRKEAEEKLLGELTAAQREKLKQLLGNEFELQTQRPASTRNVETRR